MAERLTQEPVEVLAFPNSAKERLTQEPVEVLAFPNSAKERLTQLVIEVLVESEAKVFPRAQKRLNQFFFFFD